MYIHVQIHLCARIPTDILPFIYIYVHTNTRTGMYRCVSMSMFKHMCMRMHTYVYLYMYMYMFMYIYMHTYIFVCIRTYYISIYTCTCIYRLARHFVTVAMNPICKVNPYKHLLNKPPVPMVTEDPA